MTPRSLLAAALLTGLLWASPGPGTRAGGLPLRYDVRSGPVPVATVVVQEVPVLRLLGPDAPARAAEVVRRLAGIVAARPPALTVTVQPRAGATDLLLNGRHLVVVGPAEARANRTTPEALAALWAARLREAFTRNTVTLTPGLLVLRVGETGTVILRSFLPGTVILGAYDARVAAVRSSGDTIIVAARAEGSTSVPVAVGGGRALLSVVVRREAGAIPVAVTARVTGAFAPAVVHEAVQRRLEQVIVREPGATLTIGPLPAVDPPDPDAERLLFSVPVRLRSPYALPVERNVRVTVLRETVALKDPAVLLVSNRPEVVLADGILFSETVDASHPIRLLYHHQNGAPAHSRVLTVVLVNQSARPAEMLLIGGLAGPSPDSLFVGHAATARFLQHLEAGRGYILEVPPHSSYAFTAQTLAPQQLVSGILQLQLLQGEELEVRVAVRLRWLLERTVALPVNQPAYPHPKGVFPSPTVALARAVDLTHAAPLVDLGWAAALRDLRTGEALVGDYGVVYRLDVTAHNPSEREVQADLVATAAGGPARGAFLIDGRLVEMAIFRAAEERVLATITVPPGAASPVRIVTMPTAGSFYPVRLGLRPRE